MTPQAATTTLLVQVTQMAAVHLLWSTEAKQAAVGLADAASTKPVLTVVADGGLFFLVGRGNAASSSSWFWLTL